MENAMNSVNACIYDADGRLAGCVTPSVMAAMADEHAGLCERWGEEAGGLCAWLGDALGMSCAHCDATYLNALKRVVREDRFGVHSPELLQDLSRAYHNVVRQCCSAVAYGEAKEALIRMFEDAGFRYQGVAGPDSGETAFVGPGGSGMAGMDLSDESGVLSFWNDNGVKSATVYFGGDRYRIEQHLSPEEFVSAVSCCIADAARAAASEEDLAAARELVEAAREIVLGLGE